MAFWNRKKEELPKKQTRAFNASAYAPTLDLGETLAINNDIRGGLNTIRRRARNMVQNNGHAKGVLINYKNNIIGPRGIKLTCQAKNDRTGALDTKGNSRIETEFSNWGKYGNCDVTGGMDWIKIQEMALTTTATDGECLILIRRGPEFGKWNFQLELIPAEQLDENYFFVTPEGNIVFQGVELNDYGRPIAYHIWQKNRQDPMLYTNHSNQRLRIPASDIIHLFDADSPKQVRGISWFIASLLNIHHIELLQNAELQMARLATLKQIIYTIDKPDEYSVGDEELDAAAMIKRTLSPGDVEILPPGITPHAIDWSSPHSGLEKITKTILRNVSSGMGLNYAALSGDMESVNYSSARFQALETRASYQSKQRWFINSFVERVYRAWLDVQFTTGLIPFPYDRFEKFCDVKFTGRGWQSVDPQKENAANAAALLLGTKTRSEICAESGRDYSEVLQELIMEEQMRVDAYAAAGLELPPNNPLLVPLAVQEEKNEATGEIGEDSDEQEEPG